MSEDDPAKKSETLITWNHVNETHTQDMENIFETITSRTNNGPSIEDCPNLNEVNSAPFLSKKRDL